jgi:DNA-binding response OmpR family regulator
MSSAEERKDYTITLDDDPLIHRIIQKATTMSSLPFVSGRALVERSGIYDPIAVFFDVNLGNGESGISYIGPCREVWPYSAFFVVTAEEDDTLIGQALASGANDFIKKPINHEELVARFRARVTEMRERRGRENLQYFGLRLNTRHGFVMCRDEKIWLAPLEFKLLQALVESRGNLVSRSQLRHELWRDITVTDNTLDQKISSLRKALGQISKEFRIKAVYNKGVCILHESDLNKVVKAS